MNSYKFIQHTADIRMKVTADTIEQLFRFAMLGMNQLLSGKSYASKDEADLEKEIKIASFDNAALIVDFLSEILTLSYEKRIIFFEVEFLELREKLLKAKLRGKKIVKFNEDIKAVTYHEASISKNQQGKWETMIIFDI